MCGIAGIIDLGDHAVAESQIKQMTDLVAHRGPDGAGSYLYKNLGFGHRRLSIIDLSDAGHQPMALGDDLVITFNGEVYNYIELREELRKLGHQFHTHTDTEVVLAAYKEWGASCVTRFNGMWAFAIHDVKKQIVFCSRDRFGVKPFYYTIIDNKFLFASEIKQFSAFKTKWSANKTILMDYLIFNLIDHKDQSFFEGVSRLPASHNLVYDLNTNTFEINRYYSITLHTDISRLNEPDTIALFKDEMNRSVDFRLRSDVKVGSCLSGGLDSSYLASLASGKYDHAREQFTVITAQAIEEEIDETPFAKMVVDSNDLNWLVTTPTSADFRFFLDDVIYSQEEPFISPSMFMQYFVMKKAKENGVTVLLDGQGADEVLMGYAKYLGAYLKSLSPGQLLANLFRTKHQYGYSLINILKFHLYFTSFSVRYKRNMHNFQGLDKKYLDCVDAEMIRKLAESYKDINELQSLEIFSATLPSLLRYEDKNSMANSIESRLPYLDWKFVEMALSINNQFKIKDGWSKYILRCSMNGRLPDEVTWRRKKLGFVAPTALWFDGLPELDQMIHNSPMLNTLFNGKIPAYQDDNIKWRLLNIARWEALYNVTL